MAKKSSLFKTLSTIIVLTTLTLSVATGAVIGRAVKNFTNAQQQQGKETRDVEKIEKTDNYGLIDEYTITYTDGTTSTFIVAGGNGDYGVNTFPSSDGYIPDVKIGDNGNFIVDGIDTGIAVQEINAQDPRSIVSIDKTDTSGLIDTYTITYTDGTTSTFLVVNGAEGPQGIQGLPGENGVTPTVSINDEGYWVINGQVTTFKAEGKDGTSLITGHGQPGPNEGKTGDTYFDVDSGNIYVKNETGWGQPIGNNQGASVLVGNGEPTPAEGKVGDSYIDASTGNIYIKNENGWSQPIGNNQGSSFLTGAGAPDNNQGKVGDSYLDTTTGLIYTKGENGWGTSIGSMMGPQGPQGQAGNGLLTGSGEPNPNLGNDNDSYVDTSTWNYYVKENGAWVLKGNLAGANGTTPHIGANGNWWIGNTDTGVAANGNSGTSMTTGHGNPNGDNSDPNNPIAAKEGNVGDTYVDLDTGTVYVKDENGWQVDPNGAAGIHGTTPHIGDNGNWWIGDTDTGVSATGPQGQQGQAGASVYTGTSAPSQGLGSNNDSYIDTATWNFYVKENGEWVLKGNLKGSQGQDGESISVVSCVKTSENGLVDTYTITFSNGNTATFEVVNGAAGSAGAAGANGADGHTPVITIGANGNWFVDGTDTGVSATGIQGQAGADGNGISGIIITNATATETTFRITFTNGNHFDYTVANGINGQDGADGTCMRTGETDPANDLGRDGDSYINTVTWDYFVKEAGAWVFKGNIKGASGAAGAQGAAGQNGQNGVSVSSITKTGSNGLVDTYTITYSDGSSTTFEVTNGATGATGAQGAAGQNGNTILVGIGAPTGATGGVDGDSYIDTATWNYYLKVSGNWELQGNIQGAQGVAGQNGQDGRGIASITKTGPAADGLTYTYTITYTDGSEPYVFTVTNGKNGTAVLTGVDNPTDQGVDGDSYINTTSWDYFVKENGSWVKKGNIKGVSIVSIVRTDGDGSAGTVDTYTITYSNGTTSTFTVTNGANGANGQDGQDGKTLLTGTGAPNSALGTVGDSYIDVASWTLYVKTAEDTWTSKGSFSGANGADGTSVTITDISTSGTGAPGTSDTYTVTFSDGNTLVITVYNGANGADGTNGTNGSSLLTGSIDPTTEGVDGDSYINTSTWEYFVKNNGTWTSKGIIKGNDGTSVTTGTGIPDNNDGVDGDSYIDLATWTFYVKESGTWVEHGNIHNELDKYAVNFNLSYDSDSDGVDDTYTTVIDVEHGHNINNDKPADPTRDGWIFQGWYTASGTKWDFEKDVITGNIVLYAHWAKFKVENGVLTECTATGDVVIPEFFDGQFITGIGDNVFKDNTGITSISIPNTVTSIGNSAFEGCTSLTSIIIPSSVETIGDNAFKGCSNLAYVYTGNGNRANGGLKTIGESAFEDCTSLKNLVIPGSVTSIGDNAFKGCIALESLALPYIPNDTGTSITATWSTGHGEPDDSYNGSTVYLDEDTYKVWVRTNPSDPWYVAFDMWSPSSIKFAISDGVPNNADHVDEEGYINRLNGDVYAWTGSSYALYFNFMTYQPLGISDIFASLPSTHHSIGTLFGVDNDAIPASLTTIVLNGNNAIPENALNGCSHIENIVVSGKPTSIGAGAFQGCTSLKSITLPYIGGFAYDPNTALTYSYGHGEPAADYNASNVYLDIDSTNVWQYTNGTWEEKINWASITSNNVYVDAGAPTFVPSDDDDMYIDYLTGDMYGYNGASWSVQMKITELDQWSLLDSPTGTNTAFIGYVFGASDYNSQVSYVPTSLKTIVLTGANGEKGDEISAYAFGGLTSVETIVLPNNIKQIKQYAFAAVEMDSFVIPDSVTNIFENAFYHARIRELTIPFVGMGRTQGQQNLGALFGNYHKFIETITLTGGNGVDGNVISYSAFEGCRALTSINLPNNIVRIEDNAFRYCESLTSIVIPYGVTYIGQYAFGSCTNLSYVGLPSTLTTLESFAFDSCSSLEYIVLPEGLRTIGWYAFTHSGLKNIVIPSSVTRIGADSFSYCNNLTSIVVLDGVDKIVESGAFRSCSNLKYVKFECAISSFGYAGGEWLSSYWNPFFDCNNLEYVDLGRDLLAPSDEADAGLTPFYEFKNNASGEITGVFEGFTHLKTVILPNTITNISEKTFKGCSSLTAITLPSELTNIGANAFEGCSSLAYVYFNEKLQTIGNKAFAYCSSLKAISVPNSVTTIGRGAFEAAKAWTKYDNLKSSYSPNATSIVVDVFTNRTTTGTDGDIFVCTDNDHFGHIYVRNGTGNDWVLKDTIHYSFASGTTNPVAASANSTSLNVVFINTNTGEMLINSNSKLESISLPFIGKDNGSDNSYNNIGYIFGTTTYIENHTYVPYSLKTVIINNASNIVSNAFYKCFNIETIVINGTASSVGLKAFNECHSLKNISLPSTISTINMSAFSLCSSLVNLALPNSVNTLGDYAVSNCQSLETVYLPEGLTTIGKECFFNDISLKSVYLPDSVTSVGICVFQECSALTSVRFSNNMDTISQQMFYKCTSLESIVIPGNIQRIDLNAFNGCTSLKYAFFNEGIKVIHEYAFQDCTSLTSVALPNSIKDLGRGVFHGCTSLESISLPFAGASYSWMGDVLTDDNIEIGGKPDNSVGNDNNLLADTTNDKIWRKIDGKWYSQLQFVHIGESTPGDITYGHGAPTPASGNSFYVDVDNYDFYEIDSTNPNVWHKIGNLDILFAKFAYIFVSPNGNATFDTFNNDTLSNLKTVVITKGSYNQTYDRYFIQEDSFMGCADIEHISLPKDVYTIDDNAFKGCTSLKTVTFENNSILESFGRDSFKGCSSLTSIVIPDGVVYIFDNAFMDCTLLKYVVFQDNSHVETIYKQAFANCTSLESIIIPSSVTELQIGCFQGCSSLKSITVPFVGSNATSNEYAYLGHIFGATNYSGNNTYTPASLKTVEVTGDTDLGEYAFNNCQNIETILISGNPSQIGNRAFANTYALKTIKLPFIGRSADDTGSYGRLQYIFYGNVSSTIETIILTGANGTNRDVIPDYAFSGISGVKNYVLPENITTIGNSAFQSNTSLETFVIPNSVTTLGTYAFNYCSNLTYVKLSENLTTISNYSFRSCYKLNNVTITSNITSIGEYAFDSCNSLTSIKFENGLLNIGRYAFYNCNALQAITLPSTLTTVDDYAFYRCSALLYVDLGNCSSLTTLGDYMFWDCSFLSSVKLSYGIKNIGQYAFSNCYALATIDVSSVETFGRYSFYNCRGLTSLNFNSFTLIDQNAFEGCKSLSYVYFNFGNSTVRSIEQSAFRGCVSLKAIDLGNRSNRLAKLGRYAFDGCTSIESLVLPYLGETADDNPYYLSELLGNDAANNVRNVSLEDVHTVRNGAFNGLKSLETVSVRGNDCTSIGDEAFRSCPKLRSVNLPRCAYYGRYLCSGCVNLTYFYVSHSSSDGWEYVPDYCFYGCVSLTDVYMDHHMKSFGDYAFYGCTSFIEFRIYGDNLESIGDHAFENCINLSSFPFNGSWNKLHHIGEYAFQNTAFTSLTLKANDNLEIGRGAFADCSRLKYVYLQEGIKSIGSYAFANCSIKAIVLPSSAAISESVFYGCNELESVTIPTIGFDLDTNYPNYYFGSLFGSDEPSEEASNPCVPASLKTVVVTGDGAVGYMAFANCNNIETIRFTGNPVCMASNIFSGCTSLKKVIVPYIGGGTVNGISGGTEELGLIYEWNLTPIANIKTNPSTTVKIGYKEWESYDATPLYSVGDIIINTGDESAYICTYSEYSTEWNCWVYDWENYTGDTGYALPHKENGYWYVGTTNTGFAVGSSYNSVSYGNGDPVTYGMYIDSSPWYQTPYVDMDTGNFYGITSHTYGNNGDLYYRTDEDILYRKYNDAWHVENAFGNVTTGDVAPDNANGDDGDQYINIATGDFYRKNAGVWELESNLLDQFTRFGYWFSAFTNLVGIPKSFETVEIIGNITEIKAGTFADCVYIKEVILPDSVEIIGNGAFAGCENLKNINMPTSLNAIGDSAFEECFVLKIDLELTGVTIGKWAFYNTGITSLYLLDVNVVEEGAFAYCVKMEEMALIGTTNIGDWAFNECTTLKKVLINASSSINLSIGEHAFEGCYSLDDLFIHVALITIKSLGANAFAECRSLPYIDLRNLDCDISDKAFRGCTSLQYVYMNNSANITSIGEEAFAYCTSLSYVEIGAGVNNIKNEAFSNCVNLKTLNIKSTASITFGEDVFENCHSINKIYYISASANASEWTSKFYDNLQGYDKNYFKGATIVFSDGVAYLQKYDGTLAPQA